MKSTKYILSAVLIAVMLVSGLPVFNPEDASRDRRIDLQDAVLWIRDFALMVDKPADFTANMENILSTFNILAGLKHTLKPAKDIKNISSETFWAIQPFNKFYLFLLANMISIRYNEDRLTVDLEPLTPPPRGC